MNANDADIPLVVDLDGTLLKSDSLWEGFYRTMAKRPWAIFQILSWLFRGRVALKRNLAPDILSEVADWPYNDEVLRAIESARENGRAVYLATAADETVAQAVAGHLGIFDGVFATSGTTNLKGGTKLTKLLERFPRGSFDYIGDSAADLPIWTACRTAGVVAEPGSRLPAQIGKPPGAIRVYPREKLGFMALLRLVRAQQWVKNLLIFVPLLLSRDYSLHAFFNVLLAVMAFSFCSSAIYVVNDLIDLPFDRKHEHKRLRPFASGEAPLRLGVPLVLILFIGSVVSALSLPNLFLLTLLSYFVLTCLYSFWFKRVLMLDVIVLAGFYMLRLIAGASANSQPLSNWLLGFACFIFLGLALLKRSTEIPAHAKESRSDIPGRAYAVSDMGMLESMAVASGFCSIAILALYIDSLRAAQQYSNPFFLWGLCPLMTFWYGRVLIAAHRGIITRDPISHVLRDRTSYLCAAFGLLLLLLSA